MLQRIGGELFVGVRGQLGFKPLPSVFYSATAPTLNTMLTSPAMTVDFVRQALIAIETDIANGVPDLGAGIARENTRVSMD